MKIFRVVSCTFAIILLIIVYSVSMKLIKDEDFIGTYYSVNIKSDIMLEICGTTTGIIDKTKDENIVSYVDSLTVTDDAIYGICKKKYFLLTLSDKKVVYSSTPMSQYAKCSLLSPMEYYEKKTKYLDLIGGIILLGCIIFIIKIGFFHVSKTK